MKKFVVVWLLSKLTQWEEKCFSEYKKCSDQMKYKPHQ